MSDTCPKCGEPAAGTNFCEACGTPLTDRAGDVARAAAMGTEALPGEEGDAPISAPTHLTPVNVPRQSGERVCLECGGEIMADGYCEQCGTKALSERDHFREQPAAWVAGVCDKGVGKSGNEDAMALLASQAPGERAVLVVLDGVSSSTDSAPASLAGARAAREVLRTPLPQGMGTAEGRESAARKVLTDAVAAANDAIVEETASDSANPASATFAAAVLEGEEVFHACVGDSRAYWLPDEGDGVQLTVDDSAAQVQIAAGVPREQAESSPQAHAITKWLGRDAPDPKPTIGSLRVTTPGWLMVCSDGLWNYASEPAGLREQVDAAGTTDPAELALRLVEFANGKGGRDNITVALARVADQQGEAGMDPPAPGENAADENAGSSEGATDHG